MRVRLAGWALLCAALCVACGSDGGPSSSVGDISGDGFVPGDVELGDGRALPDGAAPGDVSSPDADVLSGDAGGDGLDSTGPAAFSGFAGRFGPAGLGAGNGPSLFGGVGWTNVKVPNAR